LITYNDCLTSFFNEMGPVVKVVTREEGAVTSEPTRLLARRGGD
jgi:hypothetical protein